MDACRARRPIARFLAGTWTSTLECGRNICHSRWGSAKLYPCVTPLDIHDVQPFVHQSTPLPQRYKFWVLRRAVAGRYSAATKGYYFDRTIWSRGTTWKLGNGSWCCRRERPLFSLWDRSSGQSLMCSARFVSTKPPEHSGWSCFLYSRSSDSSRGSTRNRVWPTSGIALGCGRHFDPNTSPGVALASPIQRARLTASNLPQRLQVRRPYVPPGSRQASRRPGHLAGEALFDLYELGLFQN